MHKVLREKTDQLIYHVQRYTKIDLAYLIRGGFWLSLRNILSFFLSFGAAYVFANLFPKETYGTYKYIIGILAILSVTSLGGMKVAVFQSISHGFEGGLPDIVKKRISWGVLGSIISLGIAFYYKISGNNTLAISFFMASIFIPFLDSFGIYETYLRGKKLFKAYTLYSFFNDLAINIILIATILLSKNLFILLASYLIIFSLTDIVLFFLSLKKFPPNQKTDPQVLEYGKHASVIQFLKTLAGYIDGLLIFHYFGAATAAVYYLALSPVEQIKGVLGNIYSLAVPKFVHKTWEEIHQTLWKKTALFAIFIGIIMLGYIYTAPSIYHFVFPQYQNSIVLSQWYALSLLGAALTLPYATLEAHRSIKKIYIYNIFIYSSQIVLTFVLIYFFNLGGAIAAKILIHIIPFVILRIFAKTPPSSLQL